MVVDRATGSRARLEAVDYQHGSIMITMLIVAVVSSYPQIKQNCPIIMADIEEVIKWMENSVMPAIERRIEKFFQDYKSEPIVRLAKSIWKALFG